MLADMMPNAFGKKASATGRFPISARFLALALTLFSGTESRVASAPEPGLPSITVPEGFMVTEAVKPGLIAYPMFGAFDHDGRLYIAESSGKDVRGAAMAETPECRIRVLEDTDGDGVFDSSTVFADRIGIPMGVLHHQGSVYVASPPEFLKFTDSNGDGVADRREVLLTGWNVRGTASLHGPFLGPDGWLYLTDGRHGYDIDTKEGTNVKGLASRIWKCRPDGTGLDWFAGGGFDNPVEIVFTGAGEMIGTMTYFTNPTLGQRDALMHFIRGGVYSKDHASVSEFKRTGDLLGPLTRFARVAPAGLHRYQGTQFGDDFKNNLFSAHFNPHRVMRHVLTETNATFTSVDSDFLVSSHPDFHPTDLVEDADGSLIVIDTGGWYVDQCPLSQISKPEFRGSLYRVTRIGARPVKDPRGQTIRIANAADAVRALQDRRPVVRARARDFLTGSDARGAVGALASLRVQAADSEVRCDAVWMLHRIGTQPARNAVIAALTDPNSEVRLAAVNAIGLAKDRSAPLDQLHRLLTEDDASVRRAVASALGQIGDTKSNGPLIQAANTATNRFEEHAIIYSLIENYSRMTNSNIKHSAPQLTRLPAGSARAALIAFDQMDNSQLKQEHVLPLLDYPDPKVQAAASRIFASHADWADSAVAHLQKNFVGWKLTEAELAGLKEIMRAFEQNPKVQSIMAQAFLGEKVAPERQQLVIEVIRDSDLTKFPAQWLNPIRRALTSTNAVMREMAFGIIESRNILGFDDHLHNMAETDPRDDLRYRAYAIIARQDSLTESQIETLMEDAKATDTRKRAGAVSALSRARLSDEKLIELAHGILPKADAITLAPLLAPFQGKDSDAVGNALIGTLQKNPALWEITNPRTIEQILAGYSAAVKKSGNALIRKLVTTHQEKIRQLTELAPLLRNGSVTSGRRIFFSQKSQCSACHAVGRDGGNFGPDLTAIGKVRSGLDILEAIVFPSASFVPGYEPMKLLTKGDLHSGNIIRETKDSITLKINAATEMKFRRSDLIAIRPGEVSAMPAGLDKALTKTELSDLLAYLLSLNGEKWLQPDRLGNARKPILSPAERAAR
jgi:putative membrane-bound dehydrogenase-like protein